MTVEDLRNKWGFSFQKSKDEQYGQLIETARTAILEYLGIPASGVVSLDFYADGGCRRYVLPKAPVMSIEEVSIGGDVLSPGGYRLEGKTGILTIYQTVPSGLDVLKVRYSAGLEAIPVDIEYCIATTVQYLARLLQTNQIGVESRTMEGGTESLEQSIPPTAIKTYLDRFRLGRGGV